jgi:hypothetical protein
MWVYVPGISLVAMSANDACASLRFLPSNGRRRYHAGASRTLSFFTRCYAASTRAAPCRRCPISSVWSMSGVIDLGQTLRTVVDTRCRGSSRGWPFIRFCAAQISFIPFSRAPTGMRRCGADLRGVRLLRPGRRTLGQGRYQVEAVPLLRTAVEVACSTRSRTAS